MTEFKPKAYFPFWFRDYVTSNARAKMTWQQRAIYIELLGHCHMDNGLPEDRRVLIGKLGLATDQEKADLETVLAEFEPHEDKAGWLMHPRTKAVLEEQQSATSRGKAGAGKRWNSESAQKPKPTPAKNPAADIDEESIHHINTHQGAVINSKPISERLRPGGSPAVRQQLIELLNRALTDAGEDVLQPGEGINRCRSQEATKLRSTAVVLPPSSLPKKIQLFRPTATPRMARSVALLSIARSPSSQ